MISPRIVAIMAVAAFALSGCDRLKAPDTAPETVTPQAETPPAAPPAAEPDAAELTLRPEAVSKTATIDWEAARRDLAAIPSDERTEGSFQVQSGEAGAPVPVLLPTGIVVPQGAESGVRFQPMSDGYFATYPGIDYDIVVNGTNEVIGARESGDGPGDTELNYIATMSGAQVAFSRYGADYLVEFECKHVEGDTADCIDEPTAVEITRKLVIAGTR
jgi:hypothetical protein